MAILYITKSFMFYALYMKISMFIYHISLIFTFSMCLMIAFKWRRACICIWVRKSWHSSCHSCAVACRSIMEGKNAISFRWMNSCPKIQQEKQQLSIIQVQKYRFLVSKTVLPTDFFVRFSNFLGKLKQ